MSRYSITSNWTLWMFESSRNLLLGEIRPKFTGGWILYTYFPQIEETSRHTPHYNHYSKHNLPWFQHHKSYIKICRLIYIIRFVSISPISRLQQKTFIFRRYFSTSHSMSQEA